MIFTVIKWYAIMVKDLDWGIRGSTLSGENWAY